MNFVIVYFHKEFKVIWIFTVEYMIHNVDPKYIFYKNIIRISNISFKFHFSDLSNNEIRKLAPDAFRGLKALTSL